jgi:hypothetical protein
MRPRKCRDYEFSAVRLDTTSIPLGLLMAASPPLACS